MCEVYRIFAQDWKDCCIFSDEMMLQLYYSESYGDEVSDLNGFNIGKRYLNLQVNMWKEDISKGLFFKKELYEDDKYPHWWLDNIFRGL